MKPRRHPSVRARDNLEQSWSHAVAQWRRAKDEKQRVIAAMLAAGQQKTAEEASK